jgi:hypothetical protein
VSDEIKIGVEGEQAVEIETKCLLIWNFKNDDVGMEDYYEEK